MESAGHRALVRHCVALLDSFDPNSMATEQHISNYIAHQHLEYTDKTFITEVFSGCIRYRSVLSVVIVGFFNMDGKTLLRSSENLYRVFCYLALFRLDELGIGHFGKFVRTQDMNKMHMFLAFFFCERHLRTWVTDEWGKLYENPFVQTKLLSPLLSWMPELQEMTSQMKKKIDNKLEHKKPSVTKTELKPFQLTQPRPRSVPVPQAIPKLHPYKPVPNSMYKVPAEQEFLTKVKDSNRRKAEERLVAAAKAQFACANPNKSEKAKWKIAQIQQEQDDLLQFDAKNYNPMPKNMLSENIPIKLNAAAILREGKLYKAREQTELRKLESLEAGENDGSRFAAWQQRMKRLDADEELATIEQRRLQGKLSKEEAIIAQQTHSRLNRAKVQDMKAKADEQMQIYMENKLKEETETRKIVENIQDNLENAREARSRLQEYKAGIVQQVAAESRALMQQMLEEAEKDMKQRMEVIRQIRAMEAVPMRHFKLVDLSEGAGHGLLNEMSITELKERLCLYKEQKKEEEETIRDEIMAAKEAKDQMLMETLQTISRHRNVKSKAAAIKLEERKKAHNVTPKVQHEKVQVLERKLEEKREQRIREQESTKIRPDAKSLRHNQELHASKRLMEGRRWKELERTQEKMACLCSQGALRGQSAAKVANQRALFSTS